VRIGRPRPPGETRKRTAAVQFPAGPNVDQVIGQPAPIMASSCDSTTSTVLPCEQVRQGSIRRWLCDDDKKKKPDRKGLVST